MNYELVPCCIKNCIEAGKFGVTGNHGTVHMCATHALEVMELSKKRGKPFYTVEEDE